MTQAPPTDQSGLRHPCWMTKGRVGFISYLDASDIIAVGLAFYLAGQLGQKITTLPPLRLLILVLMTLLAWVINFAIKKRMAPYPKFAEYFVNWWLGGVDYIGADTDTHTLPLIITEDMRIGHSMDRIEQQARRATFRRRRVRKSQDQAHQR